MEKSRQHQLILTQLPGNQKGHNVPTLWPFNIYDFN